MWLWILGSVGLLLTLFLVSSVRVSFSYETKVKYRLRWLFFSVSSENMKKQPVKDEKKKQPRKEEKKQKSSFLKNLYKGEGLTGIIDILRDAAQIVQGALKYTCSHLVVKKFDVEISTAGKDAAETAILYGQVCAGVYPCAGVIVSGTKCRSYHINIYPDFSENSKTKVSVVFKARIKIFFLIKTAAVYGLRLLKIYKNRIIPSIVRGERKMGKPVNNKKKEIKNNTATDGQNQKAKE